MIPGLPDTPSLLLLVPVLLLAAALLRRVPVLGRLVSLASWILIAGLLWMAIGERGRFDPYLSEIAAMLRLERQEVVGKELRVRMSGDGHFWVRASIDGVERRMLVDSGATVTAISAATAGEARLARDRSAFPVLLKTANGMVRAETATVAELSLGNIVARDLPVVVSPSFGTMNVLGMNFLSRLRSWRVEGSTLILVPHHPQPVPKS